MSGKHDAADRRHISIGKMLGAHKEKIKISGASGQVESTFDPRSLPKNILTSTVVEIARSPKRAEWLS
jgi:hypothetical protein